MKKKLLTIALVAAMALSLSSCGSDTPASDDSKKGTATESQEDSKEGTTYQSILDEYTKKLTDAAPGLVNEYNTESADKAGDVNALAELSNSKISKLAEICNEGIQKMAELKLKNNDDESTYTEWAGKLQTVYTEQAQSITDAYMSSAMGQ